MVRSLLKETPSRCLRVYLASGMQRPVLEELSGLCRSAGIVCQKVDKSFLDRLCPQENHQGVVAQLAAVPFSRSLEETLLKVPPHSEPALALLLDHLQDPHNLGAVVRSAEVAGASFVAFPKRRGALPTGVLLKTSAGAALRVPLVEINNVAQSASFLKTNGFWVVGLTPEAPVSLWERPLPERMVLVLGAEGKGLGMATKKACDDLRRIPMRGRTGSLNASIAAALGMFEWMRMVDNLKRPL